MKPKNCKGRLKEIEKEIEHYRIPLKIADIMERLVIEAGFEFCGHGTDLTTGEEDFSLIRFLNKDEDTNITVEFSRKKLKSVSLSQGNNYITLDKDIIDSLSNSLPELLEWI